VWIDYDTVVVPGAFDGDESAVDFLGHTFGRSCERVAKTTTTPGDPLQHVAWRGSVLHLEHMKIF
jgi:hypothetical protein